MKTRAQIDELKLSWRLDPTWDIADSPGFEDHRAELANYQRQVEHERDAAAARRHEAEVQKLIARAAAILPSAPSMSASMSDAERERLSEMVGPTREIATAEGSTVNILLRLVAEMVLPLQRQLERQAEDIEAMQQRHEHVDALRRQLGGR